MHKAVALTVVGVLACVAVGRAQWPDGVPRGWSVRTSVDKMTDEETKFAMTANDDGFMFAIMRMPDEDGAMMAVLMPPNSVRPLDKGRGPTFRIDKLEAKDFDDLYRWLRRNPELNRGSRLVRHLGGNMSFLVGFAPEDGRLKGDNICNILEGNTILIRYRMLGGRSGDTSFDLTGAKPAIASMLGVSVESLAEMIEAYRQTQKDKQEPQKSRADTIHQDDDTQREQHETNGQRAQAARWRTWKDATGRFSVKAAFRGVIAGNVQLEREDGNRLSVPMDQLSEECQEWIRKPDTRVRTGASVDAAKPPAQESDPFDRPFAKVRVLTDGEFVALEDNVALDTSGRTLWSNIPPDFEGLQFLRNRHHAGTLKFQVTEPGLVLLAVTTRWGGGGRGGDWQKEVVTQKDLEADEWKEVARLDSRYKQSPQPWVVLAKLFPSPTSVSIRTEKYYAPVLILRTPDDVK